MVNYIRAHNVMKVKDVSGSNFLNIHPDKSKIRSLVLILLTFYFAPVSE